MGRRKVVSTAMDRCRERDRYSLELVCKLRSPCSASASLSLFGGVHPEQSRSLSRVKPVLSEVEGSKRAQRGREDRRFCCRLEDLSPGTFFLRPKRPRLAKPDPRRRREVGSGA